MERMLNGFRQTTRTQSHIELPYLSAIFILVLGVTAISGFAQGTAPAAQASGAPLTLTFQDALQRARQNTPEYRAAMTDLGLAREDKVQARAGLLPDRRQQFRVLKYLNFGVEPL